MRTPIPTLAIIVATALLGPSAAAAQPDQLSNVQILTGQARTYFDQLDYENTVKALDSAIGVLEARPTPEAKRLLPAAYEMRARSLFGLGKIDGARADFVSLLKVDPGYALTGQVSPRIVSLFEEVAKETVTELRLTVLPATAEVLLDGARIPSSGTIPVSVGDHTLSATRVGYKPLSQTFTAIAGTATEVNELTLERVSSVFTFVTAPSGVEVIIDGISHGRTAAGPPPAEYAEKAARAGVPASELSAVLTVLEIPIGSHLIEFKKDCYVSTQRRPVVDQLDDYVIDPVKLEPAVATLAVRANQPGTLVMVDGQQRGVAPLTINDICEGEHLVELKSASGRYFRRVTARTKEKIDIEGTLKPAFAILSASGPTTLNTDLRLTMEKQLESSQSLTLFAPRADEAAKALAAEKLPTDWLAFDLNKRPIGTAVDVATVMRADLSQKLAKTFDAQGIASITVPSTANRNRLVIALLAAGSGEPDLLDVSLDNPETIGLVVGRLDRGLSFFKPSIGLTVVDVADLEGPVVVTVDASGPAAKAGIQPGDVVLRANAQPAVDASGFASLLAGRKAEENLTLELKDRNGAAKRTDVKVFMTPRLIGLSDQSLMINRTLVDLRAKTQTPGDPVEDSVMRLNLAVALARVGAWPEARLELQRVRLADGPGVSNGTVQYLLGLAADRMGNRAEAEAAWRAAAASPALLTEEGPPVKDLAEARIAELQRRPR